MIKKYLGIYYSKYITQVLYLRGLKGLKED